MRLAEEEASRVPQQGGFMKNDHSRQPDLIPEVHQESHPVFPSVSFAASRASLLAIFLACSLSGCDKKPGNPIPPQAPPKPQAAADSLQIKVQRAVFTYSSKRPMQYQKGTGATVEPVTIHT
jgi:hypothetical protein